MGNMAGYDRSAGIYNNYYAGTIAGVAGGTVTELADDVQQLLVYPTVDSKITLNHSADEIFLPALVWTPIGVIADRFVVKTVAAEGDVHWQGWYL